MAGDPEAVFLAERRRLFGLAYRLLGSASDAEDVLQSAFETWLTADTREVAEPAAWLTTVVTNLCLRLLGSARRRRERYTGTWLPEPVMTGDGALGPADTAQQRESVSYGLLVLMERLTAAERAVYVLREAFGYRYAEIAAIVGRTEEACRQLHRRAGQRIGRPPRFKPEARRWQELTERFLAAAEEGDLAGMERLLAADVVSWTDGEGSDFPFARKPVAGRARVAGFYAQLYRKFGRGMTLAVGEVNGEPAALAWQDTTLLAVFIPDFRESAEPGEAEITALRVVLNPAKLAFAARQTLSRNGAVGDQ